MTVTSHSSTRSVSLTDIPGTGGFLTDHSASSLVRRRCATGVSSFLREADGAPFMLIKKRAVEHANGCLKLLGGMSRRDKKEYEDIYIKEEEGG